MSIPLGKQIIKNKNEKYKDYFNLLRVDEVVFDCKCNRILIPSEIWYPFIYEKGERL